MPFLYMERLHLFQSSHLLHRAGIRSTVHTSTSPSSPASVSEGTSASSSSSSFLTKQKAK